jgi:hypothetical protein
MEAAAKAGDQPNVNPMSKKIASAVMLNANIPEKSK